MAENGKTLAKIHVSLDPDLQALINQKDQKDNNTGFFQCWDKL